MGNQRGQQGIRRDIQVSADSGPPASPSGGDLVLRRRKLALVAPLAVALGGAFGMNCQGTDARVFAVAPTDHLLPADFVFVQGRNFGGTTSAELVDPDDPFAVLPTPSSST